MATNTPSSVYKPLHEYRILRVSNSPHLCELCTILSVVAQHIPLCMVSSFTKRPACLEHRQVWLLISSCSLNSVIPTFVRYAFFLSCLSSWCLSRKGLAIPLNANLDARSSERLLSLHLGVHFPQTIVRMAALHTVQLGSLYRSVPAYQDLAGTVWAVRVPVNHRTGMYRLYRAVQGGEAIGIADSWGLRARAPQVWNLVTVACG
ncbi:hypothetical protein GW17_00026354 [Ensete ventricosum]|nr:hypothetical protein GW17_00026354 [Ensete ventricosum]